MKKKRFLPWVLATASALVAAGAIAQPPAEVSGFGRYSTLTELISTSRIVESARETLNLSDAQEALWEQARSDSLDVLQTMRKNYATMHAVTAAELARQSPNFANIANIEDATLKADQVLCRKMHDIWLQVYVVLSDEQQAMVHQAMHETFGHKAKAGLHGGAIAMPGALASVPARQAGTLPT